MDRSGRRGGYRTVESSACRCVLFTRVILVLPGDTQKTTTTRRTRAAWAVLQHPVPHTLPSLTLHPVRPHISRSLEGSRAGGGADERRAPRHAGGADDQARQKIVGREAGRRAPLAPLRARASASWKRRRVRARSRCSTVIASPAGRGAAAEGGPRSWLDSCERECAWRERPGGGGWMRRRRTSAARPHDSSRAHARPLCSQPTSPGRSARAGAWGGCGPRLVERAAEPEV